MYERFSDRARKVMQLANSEAQRMHHEYIGTEHILLGLLKEGSGTACMVLKNLNASTAKLQLETEKTVQPGPDMVQIGKLPQTPRAKKVIEYAMLEARNLAHNYVGTEHLLMGLLREQEGVAAQLLVNAGLTIEKVRGEVEKLLGITEQTAEAKARYPHYSCAESEARKDSAILGSDGPLTNKQLVDILNGFQGWQGFIGLINHTS
jgi:ATP-dependent Clp protease ATP-binding subunit ClpC